jgi:hypothetical protein
MAKGKIKMGPNIVRNPEEPKSQSKVNPALSYGQRTGDTYVNKSEPPKKKKKTPPMRGGRVISASAQKNPVPPKARGAR